MWGRSGGYLLYGELPVSRTLSERKCSIVSSKQYELRTRCCLALLIYVDISLLALPPELLNIQHPPPRDYDCTTTQHHGGGGNSVPFAAQGF